MSASERDKVEERERKREGRRGGGKEDENRGGEHKWAEPWESEFNLQIIISPATELHWKRIITKPYCIDKKL